MTAATGASSPAIAAASYFPEFHEVALRMIAAQGGIFGWVTDSRRVIAALDAERVAKRAAYLPGGLSRIVNEKLESTTWPSTERTR